MKMSITMVKHFFQQTEGWKEIETTRADNFLLILDILQAVRSYRPVLVRKWIKETTRLHYTTIVL